MPVVIAVGVQWGDEGKGKIVDYLTERAELVVRFQGGNNAGHTLVVEGKKTALQLIPSGILRSSTRCLLASGVVVNPFALLDEMERLREVNIEVTPDRLGLAGELQLILPYHIAIDGARELRREATSGQGIGTTKRGIGPAYEDMVSRAGLRLIDLFDENRFIKTVKNSVEHKNLYLKNVLNSAEQINADELIEKLKPVAQRLKPYLANVSLEVNQAISAKKYVMFEGAQGCLLDIHHGTYPYVTSSHTLASYACVSAGFSAKAVDTILGISKAYCTRVGSGPFPTEDTSELGDRLRKAGNEFGTVTGRPRRCGWFDAVAARRAVRLNGITSLFITKLDVLSGLGPIKIGVKYVLDGKLIDDLPPAAEDIQRVQAEYEELPGWDEDITSVRTFSDLPKAAQKLVRRIEELTQCAVGGFSVGPDRTETIILDDEIKRYSEI